MQLIWDLLKIKNQEARGEKVFTFDIDEFYIRIRARPSSND